MAEKEIYKQYGYQKGCEDAKRTGGNIKQENIDRYLNYETQKLSTANTREFIEGWYAGFNDVVGGEIFNLAKSDDFWERHIHESG